MKKNFDLIKALKENYGEPQEPPKKIPLKKSGDDVSSSKKKISKKVRNRKRIYEILQTDLNKKIAQLEMSILKSKIIAARISDEAIEEELEKMSDALDRLKEKNDGLKDAIAKYLEKKGVKNE